MDNNIGKIFFFIIDRYTTHKHVENDFYLGLNVPCTVATSKHDYVTA